MKKATLVLATAVAFLLSGPVFAARKYVDMPTTKEIFGTSTIATSADGVLKVNGGALQEFIPGVKNAVAIVPEASVASSAISTLAKNVIKGGVAGLVVTVAFDELLDGVDWVIHDGSVVKLAPGNPVTTYPDNGDIYFYNQGSAATRYSSVTDACHANASYGMYPITGIQKNGGSYLCTVQGTRQDGSTFDTDVPIFVGGGGCPSGTTLSTQGSCVGAFTYAPVSDSDLTVLDGFIKGKDGVWQRGLTNELCNGSESCYKALSPQTSLSGPSSVSGTPQTVTTTKPDGSQSVSVKTPQTTITYGPNYYDYSTTTTTTNNNGGDSTTTTDDTDTALPVPPDIFGGANDGIGGIRDGIPGTTPSTSPIPYMAWWSWDQSCSEITFVIPVYGSVTTAFCPVYKQYIWPILYFFFAVFTWHHCFQVWRNTVMRVRAY